MNVFIISCYGWSSYVISFVLRQYLSFVPYIIERVPKYLGTRGDSLFFRLVIFSADDLISIQICISHQIHYGSFVLFPTLCVLSLSLSHVTVCPSK